MQFVEKRCIMQRNSLQSAEKLCMECRKTYAEYKETVYGVQKNICRVQRNICRGKGKIEHIAEWQIQSAEKQYSAECREQI
jgi:hypothetical protein